MPTFQTTPMQPWIFPDHAYHMNHRGTIPEPVERPFQGIMGSPSPWAEHDNKVAMDRVRNTQKAKLGMEGHLNVTARSQRQQLPASRSAVPNGVFEGSPMEYVTSAGLRGGVITTKQGQEWLAKRLKERAEEYGALSSGAPAKPFTPIVTSPYTELDTTFSSLFTAFSSATYNTATVELASKLLMALLKVGSVIQPSELAVYSRHLGKLIETIRPYYNEEGQEVRSLLLSQPVERGRIVDQIYKTFQLCDQVVREIARTVYDSQSSRDQVMSTLTTRLLGSQAVQYGRPTPDVAATTMSSSAPRREAIQAVQPVPMGQQQPTFPPPPAPPAPVPEVAMEEEEAYNLAGLGRRHGRRGRPRKY